MRFMTKDGITVNRLIERLISKKVGDRVPTVEAFRQEFEVGRGTVQRAFHFLEENGALQLESHGRSGTTILYIDRNKLLRLYGKRRFIGGMPLPYSLRYQGLATGLFLESQKKGIDLQMAFMRGAESRLAMLMEEGYDFVILSRLSAEDAVNAHSCLEILANLGARTYVNEHLVILNSRFDHIENGMRFGVDVSSRDMMILTGHMCRDADVTYVRLPYLQLLSKVERGEIDGAVVNTDDIEDLVERFHTLPLDFDTFQGKDAEASVVSLANNYVIRELFSSILSSKDIIDIQKSVIEKTVDPIY